jgi:hypothetical protein
MDLGTQLELAVIPVGFCIEFHQIFHWLLMHVPVKLLVKINTL